MKKNENKGFTLVELLISVAIMAIIGVIVTGIMTTSMRTYSSVNDGIGLQYRSQLVMAQLQEYVTDCNGGISWDGSTLSVVYLNDDNTKTLHAITLNAENQLLYGTATSATPSATPTDVMAEDVTVFTVTPSESDGVITSILIATTLVNDSDSYEAEQTFALRNKPKYATSLSAVLAALTDTP